jgi:hypothetical protein
VFFDSYFDEENTSLQEQFEVCYKLSYGDPSEEKRSTFFLDEGEEEFSWDSEDSEEQLEEDFEEEEEEFFDDGYDSC